MRTPVKAMLCSKLAIATALVVGATPAAAQSLIGNGSFTNGTGSISTSPNTTTVNLTSTQSVIDWTATATPSLGLVTFQASGTTANFQSGSDFAVLNRVSAPGNAILMDGTINSSVGGTLGRGTVYFYSADGIVMGANSTVNVGSLGLTTSPIQVSGGTWISGFGGASPTVVFGQALNPDSFIRVDGAAGSMPGAVLNANGAGSYVALVAPMLIDGGTIRTDGAAALVAAEAATITFSNSNLYDIQVTSGTSHSDSINLQGAKVQRNSATIGGDHRAYLVAVPKNDATTILIANGSELGFDIAGSAGIEGNVVVLSAGLNVFGGDNVGPPNAPANLVIDNAAFTSNVEAHATDTLTIGSNLGTTSFSGAVDLWASNLIQIRASNDDLTFATTLTADASNSAFVGVGGDIELVAENGNLLSVGGNVTLLANGNGFTAVGNGQNAGHGTGGTILVQAATGGTLSLGARLTAHADGLGGNHGFSNGIAGNGTGGTVQVLANDGGSTIYVTGRSDLTADGVGGTTNACQTCSIVGGSGVGGLVDVNGAVDDDPTVETENMLTFGGRLLMTAQGIGGAGDAGAGSGQGGQAYLSSADGAIINVNNQMLIFADGLGGNHLGSGIAGSGTGGTAGVGSFWGPGGQININSGITLAHVTAEGFGGDALLAGGTGGAATGGSAFVHAPGAAIAVTGALYVSAYALGGDANSGTGGAAQGGDSFVKASGPDLLVTTTLDQRAEGMGGDGLVGGAGTGGFVTLEAADNATVTINGASSLTAFGEGGEGGFAVGGVGGFGDGGAISARATNNGTLALYSLDGDAGASGGDGRVGGAALGGNLYIGTLSGGDITLDYQLFASTEGHGGYGDDGNGGEGEGGITQILADNGTITINDLVDLSASGFGGDTNGAATMGGLGDGGLVVAGATNGGTLTALSNFDVYALGRGGGAFATGATGGNGLGGTIDFRATGTGSTIDAGFFVSLDASGSGGVGDCGDCSGGGAGGNGFGGLAIMQTYGGLGNEILLGDIEIIANGSGASGYGGPGGHGIGGDAIVALNNDGLIDIGGDLLVAASGEGGYQSNGQVAGNGVGGDAAINLTGTVAAQLNVGGTTDLDADGYGGGAGAVVSGTAGNGTGGFARIAGNGGEAEFTGSVTVAADGTGGSSFGGTGGNGVGGRARVYADGSTLDFLSDLSLAAISTGGDGATGGDALAFIGNDPRNTATTDARILATNGSINVVGATLLDVSAMGGDGANGGAGGNASSGYATVHAHNSDLGPATITLAGLSIDATVAGGAGGNGINAGIGGDGGAGGFATGGFVAVTASAGNGHLDIGIVSIDGTATGGAGGWGGNGDTGAGGNGGAGGAATGADLAIGTESGVSDQATLINQGSASFASISSVLDAFGGAGGWGASGTTNGVGGVGGYAQGGDGYLQARGSLVTVGDVIFTGHATGGSGGYDPFESPSGVGGDAIAGGIGLSASNREDNTSMRGTIDAEIVDMRANATGGTGSTPGLGYAGGRNFFGVRNSDVTMSSFTMLNSGSSGGDPTAVLDPFYVFNGAVAVTGDFTVVNPTIVSVLVDSGTLSAANFSITAGNFIHDVFNPAPTNIGTLSADTITLISGQDIIVDAHLVSSATLSLDALGLIDVRNLTASGGIFTSDIMLNAGSTITAGTINADGDVDVEAGGDVLLGNVTAGGGIDFEVGGSMTGGNMTSGVQVTGDAEGAITLQAISAGLVNPQGPPEAGFSVGMTSATSINVGNVAGAEAVGFATLGAITTGNIIAGTDVLVMASGDMSFGAITAGPTGRTYLADSSMFIAAGGGDEDNFNPELVFGATPVASPGSITTTGPVSTGSFQAAAASISTGNINAANFIDILATTGGVTTGNLTTALSGISISAFGSVVLDDINSADFFFADTNVNLEIGDLNLSGIAVIDVGGNITTGTIDAAAVDFYAGGNIEMLDADVSGWLDVEAAGALLAGDIAAGDEINLNAGLALVAGNLSAGIINPPTGAVDYESNVGVFSETSVQVGDVEALGWVGMVSLGTINAGSITSGDDVLLAADGNISVTGGITTGADSRLLIVSVETALLGDGATEEDEFDRSLVFAAVDAGDADPTGGSVTINGPVSSGEIDIFAGQNVNVGAIDVGNKVFIVAGGSLNATDMTAGGSIELMADGALIAQNLSAGIVNPSEVDEYSIGLRSLTSVAVGTLTAGDFVGIASGGTIQTGSITSGGDVIALAEGNAQFGGITTNGEGRLLIAGFDLLELGGGYDNPDNALLFAAVQAGNEIATNGAVTIGGPVSGGWIDIFAGDNLTTASISADDILARAGGTITINGLWDVRTASLWSNDIAIGASGGIDGAEDISLLSTNATQMLIGDGLSGNGYALSNAEFGRLDAPVLRIYGNSGASAAIDTLIGDLTLTPAGGSSYIGLGTLNAAATGLGGSVRVVGSVTGSGFGSDDTLAFAANRFEVDAATGSVSLVDGNGGLAGTLEIDAQQVHVAKASILDQLADDSNYTGRDQDLATAPATERPDGIIRAAEIYVNFTDGGGQQAGGVTTNATPLYSLMVQNTGSGGTRAGFVANYAEVVTDEGTPDGAVDMVVNGQLIIDGVTLTGIDTRDALIEINDPARFSATSTINGCGLTGSSCVIRPVPPPIEPTPDIATQITLIGAPTSDDQPFGNEEAIEDNEEDGGEDSASSPIQPPAPLFNTKPLEVPGDTDEPVSGGGNPALVGNGPVADDDDEEDE